jgi:hypothetical protein
MIPRIRKKIAQAEELSLAYRNPALLDLDLCPTYFPL